MKKTLIALAAVAVSSAAMAQVTISGGMAYGYQSTTTNNAKDSGFGVDTAAVTFNVAEDLGNGVKLSGNMTVAGLARSGGDANGENMSMTLSGGFGDVTVGAIEIGSGIRGLAQAGAPVNNMEKEVLAAAVDYDFVGYKIKLGDVTLSANMVEDATAPGIAGGTAAGDKTVTTFGLAYASGPVALSLDTSSGGNTTSGELDSRYRLSASYDLGVAKIGAGIEDQDLVGGGSTKYTMVGVSVPMGALTLGAVMASKDTSADAGKLDGYSVGVKYALSKRTNLSANMAKWDRAEGGTVSDKKNTILLNHSF